MVAEAKTLGISPKAVLAFLFPLISATAVAVGNWISVGSFDTDSVKAVLAGLVLSGVSALGAWLGKPGTVVPAGVAVPALQAEDDFTPIPRSNEPPPLPPPAPAPAPAPPPAPAPVPQPPAAA